MTPAEIHEPCRRQVSFLNILQRNPEEDDVNVLHSKLAKHFDHPDTSYTLEKSRKDERHIERMTSKSTDICSAESQDELESLGTSVNFESILNQQDMNTASKGATTNSSSNKIKLNIKHSLMTSNAKAEFKR